MDTTEEYLAALASGDADRVNDAIDSIDDLDRERRHRIFGDAFDGVVERYRDADDGYRRQSTVRFLRELASIRLPPDERLRLAEFYCEALEDDDGRVRKAVIKGLKPLFLAADDPDVDAEIRAMIDYLDDLADQYDGTHREHVEEAVRELEWFTGPMSESIRGALEEFDGEFGNG